MPTVPTVSESILASIKKMLGIDDTYDAFDIDVIVGINTALMSLQQIGVGPEDGLSISDRSAVWSSLHTNEKKTEAAKMYIYLKVKLSFDPPTSGFVVDAINKQLDELAWRLQVQTDIPIEDSVVEEEGVV